MITVKMKNLPKISAFRTEVKKWMPESRPSRLCKSHINYVFFKKKQPQIWISVFCCFIFIWFIKTKLKKPKVNKNMLFLSLNVLSVYQTNIFQFVQFVHKIKNKNIPLIFLKLFGAPCRTYPNNLSLINFSEP